MNRNVIVVGGGLSGLAAAIYLARAGRPVTLFEKRRFLGGRALTTLRHGFRFNLGAHTFHRGGAAAAVCRELGVPVRGGTPKMRGLAFDRGRSYPLPAPWLPLLGLAPLSLRTRRELGSALLRIRRGRTDDAAESTLQGWLDSAAGDQAARDLLLAMIRSVTFSDHADRESAAFALAQMRGAMRGAVYVDEGWQKIVDALHSAAISSGVNFVTSSRVVGIDHDGAVRGVELGGLELDADRMDTQSLAFPSEPPSRVNGARLAADAVILAVDPHTAASLAGEPGSGWTAAAPVTAACLDVALRSLPRPRASLVVGIDQPVYLAAHSSYAQLTPKGGALLHTVRYHRDRAARDEVIDGARRPGDAVAAADERELESLLDTCQPGWRDEVIHRRFLPAMTVSNALTEPGRRRPGPATSVRGLYLAGDWVGDVGLLADAAFASARAAAQAILRG